MKILLVEDEKDLRETVKAFLVKEKFVVECAEDYPTAVRKISEYDYDCILLDIMLPGGSGLSVLAKLKKQRKQDSVIIISAKNSIEDKVEGLELGADDYLAKPFHLAELNARIKSLLRRKKAGGDTSIILGNVTLYPDTRKVMIDEKEMELNRKEFDILYYFMSNPNRLINRTALAESVWGDHIDQADSLDFIYSQMKNLRKKMKTAGSQAEIKSVYGMGYKLTMEE
ncbi:MAG: response regulator transcription factor [Paraprevotella sp.]|jgi:DNA-binding response OmpR family regulator|nr:response regulator transcription factor [Paraprevotella sp.]MBR0361070.1 response regulator transcription factor [Paraprevotella sp.]